MPLPTSRTPTVRRIDTPPVFESFWKLTTTDWYTWTRDAALVFTCIVETFTNNYDAGLQTQIQNYIVSQARLQGVSNPSGGLGDGAGLAEPKFYVDLTQYTGAWGK